jgi:hypothetical protein
LLQKKILTLMQGAMAAAICDAIGSALSEQVATGALPDEM